MTLILVQQQAPAASDMSAAVAPEPPPASTAVGSTLVDSSPAAVDQDAEDDEVHEAVAAGAEEHSGSLRRWLERSEKLPDCVGWMVRPVLNPPVVVELSLKVLFSFLLYAFAIWFALSYAFSAVADSRAVGTTLSLDVPVTRQLRIELTGCVLHIGATRGRGDVRVTNSTLRTAFRVPKGSSEYVALTDTGDCLVVSCMGPSEEVGYLTTAYLEIGPSTAIANTTVEILTSARSTLLVSGGLFGSILTINGQAAIVQLDSVDVPSLDVSLKEGMVDIRKSNIPTAKFALQTAALSIQSKKTVGTRIYLKAADPATVTAKQLTSNLCLSHASDTLPSEQVEGGSIFFDIGGPTVLSTFTVTRGDKAKAVPGQIFISQNVAPATRSSENTFDSTSGTSYKAEAKFATWAKMMRDQGMQLLRVKALAPGLNDEDGGLWSRGEWVYSVHGDVYMWHSASLFWLATFGLFAPSTAREVVLVPSGQCTTVSVVGKSPSTCSIQQGTSLYDQKVTMGGIHAALWESLPAEMQFRNTTHAELYFVETLPSTGPGSKSHGLGSSIADGKVMKFKSDSLASDGYSLVSFTAVNEPDKFMKSGDHVFMYMGYIVECLAVIVVSILAVRGYQSERDKILASEGFRIWPLLWNSEVKKKSEKEGVPAEDCGGLIEESLLPSDAEGMEEPPLELGEELPEEEAEEPPKEEKGLPPEEEGQEEPPKPPLRDPFALVASVSATLQSGHKHLRSAFEVEKSEVRKKVEGQAHHLIADSAHIFTVLDVAVLGRMPGASKFQGLPSALYVALMHFAVVACLCVPLYSVAWLWLNNSVFQQTECALIDMARSACGFRRALEPVMLMMVVVMALCVMLFFSVVDYLARQIDHVVFRKGRPEGKQMSRHRRRLMKIRASSFLKSVLWVLALSVLVATVVFFVGFCLYITLGACVDPHRLIPVLLAVVAVLAVAQSTYTELQKLQKALKEKVTSMKKGAGNAAAIEETAEETLRAMGLNSTQVLLITLAVCIAFAAFIAFILLGCMMFIAPESFIPTLISSGMVLLSTGAMIQGGKVKGSSFAGKNDTTAMLNMRFAKVSAVSGVMTGVTGASDGKTALAAATKLDHLAKTGEVLKPVAKPVAKKK
ncbi:unnamed protein product [Polarella glacialis]|uniref:Uncharacterized protein n=1 Tax=Polarella glacialis TaxID=89957 RepID=A0A813I892_POLGL|nr:unnamed protein product [Polarella glacialis]